MLGNVEHRDYDWESSQIHWKIVCEPSHDCGMAVEPPKLLHMVYRSPLTVCFHSLPFFSFSIFSRTALYSVQYVRTTCIARHVQYLFLVSTIQELALAKRVVCPHTVVLHTVQYVQIVRYAPACKTTAQYAQYVRYAPIVRAARYAHCLQQTTSVVCAIYYVSFGIHDCLKYRIPSSYFSVFCFFVCTMVSPRKRHQAVQGGQFGPAAHNALAAKENWFYESIVN